MFSHKLDLIRSSREAALAAIQVYNNPQIIFKTEIFIVLMTIAWTYFLHAYYREKRIEYRLPRNERQAACFQEGEGPVLVLGIVQVYRGRGLPTRPDDQTTKINLLFLNGLRDQVVHRKAPELDTCLSGRYQACALNYNRYLKELFGSKYGLDKHLLYSIQLAEFSHQQT